MNPKRHPCRSRTTRSRRSVRPSGRPAIRSDRPPGPAGQPGYRQPGPRPRQAIGCAGRGLAPRARRRRAAPAAAARNAACRAGLERRRHRAGRPWSRVFSFGLLTWLVVGGYAIVAAELGQRHRGGLLPDPRCGVRGHHRLQRDGGGERPGGRPDLPLADHLGGRRAARGAAQRPVPRLASAPTGGAGRPRPAGCVGSTPATCSTTIRRPAGSCGSAAPTCPGDYDDGGLVDINSVAEHVVVGLPACQPEPGPAPGAATGGYAARTPRWRNWGRGACCRRRSVNRCGSCCSSSARAAARPTVEPLPPAPGRNAG